MSKMSRSVSLENLSKYGSMPSLEFAEDEIDNEDIPGIPLPYSSHRDFHMLRPSAYEEPDNPWRDWNPNLSHDLDLPMGTFAKGPQKKEASRWSKKRWLLHLLADSKNWDTRYIDPSYQTKQFSFPETPSYKRKVVGAGKKRHSSRPKKRSFGKRNRKRKRRSSTSRRRRHRATK